MPPNAPSAKTDPEVAELAHAIAGDAPATDRALIEQPDGGVGLTPGPGEPSAAPASQGKEEGQAPPSNASQGDEGGEGEPSKADPLQTLTVDDLLKHPQLGPLLNRWADNAAGRQVRSALERERASTRDQTRQELEDEAFAREVDEMEPEELAVNLRNREFQSKYARYVERSQAPPPMDEAAVTESAQVFAYAAEIAIHQALLKDSGFSAEELEKPELKPETYTQYGPDGIAKFGAAVQTAVLERKAEARAQELLEERWEAFQQERVAEEDGVRPVTATVRRGATRPDIMRTDSASLLEAALSKGQQKEK